MKIGILLPGFSASEKDWCIPALLSLVREMSRQNEIHVYALRYPHRRSTYRVHGATVQAFCGAETRDLARLALLARVLRTLWKEHRKKPFDIFHGLWADEAGFLAAFAGRALKVPSVVSLLGGELVGFPDIRYGSQLSRVNGWMVRMALGAAHAVTVGSSYLRALAETYVDAGRLHFLPIGVDTALFHPRDESVVALDGDFKLLHVASLVSVKNQTLLLHALSLVQKGASGVHLHIVGDGPLREELESLAVSLNLSRNVTFHGHVRHEKLPHYYRTADLCVLASRHEGQEWVTQEAAACGRATVGTEVGVVADLVPATRTVPVGDAKALAREVASLVARPFLTRVMGQACRGRIEQNYTLSHTTRNLQTLYVGLRRVSRMER